MYKLKNFKNKTLVFPTVCSKCENNNNEILKQWDVIILKHFGFIKNIRE